MLEQTLDKEDTRKMLHEMVDSYIENVDEYHFFAELPLSKTSTLHDFTQFLLGIALGLQQPKDRHG